MAAHPGNHGNRGPLELAETSNAQIQRSVTGTVKTNAGNSQFYSKFGITLHNTSLEDHDHESSHQIGHRKSHSASSISTKTIVMKKMTSLDDCGTKFPKLEECAHFHYDFVEIGPLQVLLSNENQENLYSKIHDGGSLQLHFYILVTSRDKTWTIRRTYDNLRTFDKQLHRCIFDRKFSQLPELRRNELTEEGIPAMKKLLMLYLNRFTSIAGNMINCGPVLSWLELDNRGNRLIVSDDSAINTPAVAAAHVTKRYTSQDQDEISFEVGDIVSIIDMPPGDESVWWRGKKGFEVGFFPAENVELINEKLSPSVTSQLPLSKPKPVLRRHGKLISLLRNFFSSRPARTQLKRSGIVKERVFGCDLGEHLLNTCRDIPLVLECCTETIETHGLVDGIYRLSGVASNIQKLRNEFDEERVPCLTDECYLQDIHSISSLVKAYFRDLPNPLFTFQLYDKFFAAIQDEENKLMRVHDVIQQLPPPHYRTAKYLMEHLMRVSQHGVETGMHCKNLAIVWAPNLLRSKELEQACSTAMLQGVGVQAIVTEYLISHADLVFSDQLHHLDASAPGAAGSLRRGRPKSLAISTPTKLLSLEEARAMVNTQGSPKQKFIEVGGGPSNLPDKYHTIIALPHKKKSRKDRKSPSGWRSIFSKKGQITKVKDQERSDSLDSASSGMLGTDVEVYDDEVEGPCRLRTVRSADSLLNESRIDETSRAQAYNRFSDNTSDNTMFVNYYADAYQPDQTRTYSLDRLVNNKSTKRSISADNSYSESEMEPIIDMSPADDVFVSCGLDDSSSPRTGMMSELESRLHGHSSSPHNISRSYTTDVGSMPVLMPASHHDNTGRYQDVIITRPKSQLMVGSLESEHGQQPLMPKRSKSAALTQADTGFHIPVPAPRNRISSNPRGSEATGQPLTVKVKVMSPGKRKKAKAPLPPVVPPRHPRVETKAFHQTAQPVARSIENLVTIELSESPGVRRKLLYSEVTAGSKAGTDQYRSVPGHTGARDLEMHGLEGAPGQMASYEQNLTDDEAFNTQNLSLTTDSETETEKRESLSTMDGVQDSIGRIEMYEQEADVKSESKDTDKRSSSDDNIVEQSYSFPTATELQIIEDYNTSGSGEANIPYGFDQSSIMEKSLDSMLKGAADPYYSSDEVSHPGAPAASFAELLDSNSDSQMSGATMSTNFTTSSELPCVSSTSDEDLTSAHVYADHLRLSSSKRPQYIRHSLVDYSTTSDSDSYDKTPIVLNPPVSFPPVYSPSDSDTEIAKTPDDCSTATGQDSGDQMTPNIDLSDSEVVFVDPHARLSQEGYDPILDEPLILSSEIKTHDFQVPKSPDDITGEPGQIVIRTPLEDSLEGQAFHSHVSRVVKPPRLVAHGIHKTDNVSPTSDPVGTGAATVEPPPTKGVKPVYGDGYLADRSSSASPTFGDAPGKLVKKKASYKEQEIEIAVGESPLHTVTEITQEEPDALLEPPKILESQTISNDEGSSYHSMNSHRDLKKSADSLLFEMEDLDSNMRDSGRSSIDKLNISSENEEVFFRPDSFDMSRSMRSETNMSISPDNYLEEDAKSMQSVEDSPVTDSSTIINQTSEYQMRSAASMDREKKKGSELSRKQSVRELLSKFESSTPSGESSDDTAKGSATESSCKDDPVGGEIVSQEVLPQSPVIIAIEQKSPVPAPRRTMSPVGMAVSPIPEITKPKPGSIIRKPSAGISDRIKSFHSGYSSSEESEPTQQQSGLVVASSPNRLSEGNSDSDRELSSSPRIHDLKRQFEERKQERNRKSSSQEKVTMVSTSKPATEVLTRLHIVESSSDSTSTVNKDTSEDDDLPQSLADRLKQFQNQSSSVQLEAKSEPMWPSVTKRSSEPIKLEDANVDSQKSSLSERLHCLSERFRSYEEPADESERSTSEPPAPTSKVTRLVSNRSRTQPQPLAKGQFFTRYGQTETEPVQAGASSSVSESESNITPAAATGSESVQTTLSERRRKFESFGAADRHGETSSDDSSKPVISASLPRSTSKRQSSHTPASISEKAHQFGMKSVLLQPSESNVTSSTQTGLTNEHQDDTRAATLPRDSNTKDSVENPVPMRRKKKAASSEDKHISVKDLSRQFERQVSEQSDSSRGSTRGATWNCASDIANGNTQLDSDQNNQNSLNRNTTAQSWTTIL